MKRYEISLKYSMVSEGPARTCKDAESVVDYMFGAFDERPEQETFYVILMNRKNYPKGRHLCTIGTGSATVINMTEVFRAAIMASAPAIICVHNHPSGDPTPSGADIQITRQLRDAAKIVGIDFLDHIVMGDAGSDPAGVGHYSFRNAGLC